MSPFYILPETGEKYETPSAVLSAAKCKTVSVEGIVIVPFHYDEAAYTCFLLPFTDYDVVDEEDCWRVLQERDDVIRLEWDEVKQFIPVLREPRLPGRTLFLFDAVVEGVLRRMGWRNPSSVMSSVTNISTIPAEGSGKVRLSHFSGDVQRILLSSGWHPKRRISTEVYREAYQRNGFEALDSALDLLQQFGELEVCLPCRSTPGYVKCFDFRASKSIDNIGRRNVALWEEDYDTQFCPVGECDNGALTLLICPKGRVISVLAWQLDFPMGDSIVTTIEDLCRTSTL